MSINLPRPAHLRFFALIFLPAALAIDCGAQARSASAQPSVHPIETVSCATLAAAQRATVTGPASETAFDTARIQNALDACPEGQAVELTVAHDSTHADAFLTSPLHLRAGITLTIDAGVTLFASRNPADYGHNSSPRAVLTVEGKAALPAQLTGYGVIEGRGGAALLDTHSIAHHTWYDLDPADRPVLIDDVDARLRISGITLRNAPGVNVRIGAQATLAVDHAVLEGNAHAAGTNAFEIMAGAGSLSIDESAIATQGSVIISQGSVIVSQPGDNLRVSDTQVYSSEQFGNRQCVLTASAANTVCTPAALPLYKGALSSALNAQHQRQLTAIVSAPDSEIPVAAGEIQFFCDGLKIGDAQLHGTTQAIAEFNVDEAASGNHIYTASFEAAGIRFGTEDRAAAAHPLDSTRAVSSVNLAGPNAVVFGQTFALTASVTPASASGLMYFTDAAGTALGTVSVAQGNAVLPVGWRPVGTSTFYANYGGDAVTAPASASLSVQVSAAASTMLFMPQTVPIRAEQPVTFQIDVLGSGALSKPLAAAYFSPAINATTAFLGDSEFAYWALPMHNHGVPGEPSASILSRMPDVIHEGYERVVILAGTNDVLHAVGTPSTIVANIQTMTEIALANNLRPILCTLPPIYKGNLNPQVIAANDLIREFARKNHFVLVDFYTVLYPDSSLSYDGVHQRAAAYALMESALALTLVLPSGRVNFPDGTSTPLSGSGTATWTPSYLPSGVQTLTATYTSDPNLADSAASTSVTVPLLASSTGLVVNQVLEAVGSKAVLNASVGSTGSLPPSGNITFFDGTTSIGYATLASDGTASLTTDTLADGAHYFSASFPGDIYLGPSKSTTSVLPVHFVATTITLTSSATTVTARTVLNINAGLNTKNATGSVTFVDSTANGSTILSVAPLSGSSAAFSTPALTVGLHTIVASYPGDTYDMPSRSAPMLVQVTQNATVTTLLPIPASTFGDTLKATINVTPATSVGTIHLLEVLSGGRQIPLAQADLNQGSVTLVLPALPVGHHKLVAAYDGSANDVASTGAPIDVEVDAIGSTSTLASSASASPWNTPFTLKASVVPADAPGTFVFTDSVSGLRSQVPVVAGSASWTVPSGPAAPAPGIHGFMAAYSGDDTHAPSNTSFENVTTVTAASTITLAPIVASPTIGSSFLMSVLVAPADATGIVTFRDLDSGVIGHGTVASGYASLQIGTLAVGRHRIVADYSGEVHYGSSTSNEVDTEIVLNPSSTVLHAPTGTVYFGAPPVMNVTITPANATGTVTYTDSGSGILGTAIVSSGGASFRLPTLSIGHHLLAAHYSGDGFYNRSMSVLLDVVITADNTSTSLTLAQTSVTAGVPVIFNMRVSTTLPVSPTGLVTVRALRSGQPVTIGSAPLANSVQGASFATLAVDSLALGLGDFSNVTAAYEGDVRSSTSDSSAAPVAFSIVRSPVAVVLSLSATQVPVLSPVSVKAVVRSPLGIATGTVTFMQDGAVFASSPLDSTGAASVVMPAVAVGSYAISTSYTPSGLFASAVSTPQILAVTPPVSIRLQTTTLDLKSPGTGTATLIVQPLSGFAGTVSAACVSPIYFITCTIESSAAVNGNPVSLTLHASVAGSSQARATSKPLQQRSPAAPLVALVVLPLGALMTSARRRRANLLLSLLCMLAGAGALAGLSGCGTGGNFGIIPPGTYAVQVHVGASGVDTSVPLTIKVTP